MPTAVGVPVIDPSSGAMVRPGGRLPADTDQVKGGVPPSTVKMLAEYVVHSVPLGSGVHDICTAPTMFLFGCQPLKVLQINVTLVETCVAGSGGGSSGDVSEAAVSSTLIPVPLRSGESGAVRPTGLFEIVTLLLEVTEIPMLVPPPVIVLLSMGRVGGTEHQDCH